MNALLAEQTGQQTELDALSQENISRIKDAYIASALEVGQFSSAADAEEAIEQRESAAQAENSVTINMSAAGLNRLLTVGKVETYWDAKNTTESAGLNINGKAMHGEYDQVRSAADEGYKKYAPEGSTRPDPIYAALATKVDKRGAAPEYGNCWVVLSEAVADRAVYGFSDSHASVLRAEDGSFSHDNTTVLNRGDALTAKAVTELVDAHTKSLNLRMMAGNLVVVNAGEEMPKMIDVNGRRPGYVEAAIFDEVELNDIAEIHVAMTDRQAMHDVGVMLRTNPLFAEKAVIENTSKTSQLVNEWFASHTGEDQEGAELSPLWERLGLDPSSGMQTVTHELKKAGAILLRDISRITYKPGDLRMVAFKNDANWHNHIRNVKDTGRYLSPKVQPKLQQLLEDFVAVEEARVFFNEDDSLT